jgi:hypothetical protein
VPGDAAAAVDVDHGSAVCRSLEVFGALARRIDRVVLEQQHGVVDRVGNALLVQRALLLPGLEIRDPPGTDERDHAVERTPQLWITADVATRGSAALQV